MGRPLKKGLNYFNVDCLQEDNLSYVEAKHGITGYGIVIKLWRKIYMLEGYFTIWNDKTIYLFAREIGVDTGLINEVVNSCFQEGIFSKEMFDQHQILTSRGIQKRYIKIVTEAKRKDTEIEEKYRLLELTPEEKEFPPEETPKIPGFSTQKKVKEKKVKETINPTGGAPDKPAPEKKVSKAKEEKIPEPFWNQLVKIWFDFVQEKFGEPPLFAGADPRTFQLIIDKLKQRAAQKKFEWTEARASDWLKVFFAQAFADPWLATHFTLKNLDTQFEQIGRDKNVISTAQKQQQVVDPAVEVQQLYEKFQDGKPNELMIQSGHYDFLKSKGLVNASEEQLARAVQKRKTQLAGSNQHRDLQLLQLYEKNPEAAIKSDKEASRTVKRIVVLEFFYQLEINHIKNVLDEQKV